MDVQILLNGEPHAVRPRLPAKPGTPGVSGPTVADLVASLGLLPEQVAVERNERLVPRRSHAQTPLESGDRVEVVTLVGGG